MLTATEHTAIAHALLPLAGGAVGLLLTVEVLVPLLADALDIALSPAPSPPSPVAQPGEGAGPSPRSASAPRGSAGHTHAVRAGCVSAPPDGPVGGASSLASTDRTNGGAGVGGW